MFRLDDYDKLRPLAEQHQRLTALLAGIAEEDGAVSVPLTVGDVLLSMPVIRSAIREQLRLIETDLLKIEVVARPLADDTLTGVRFVPA